MTTSIVGERSSVRIESTYFIDCRVAMADEAEREDVILKFVAKVQKKLTYPETKNEKVIKYLENLQKLPISLNTLKISGIGKTVNKLKKQDGRVGELAKSLIDDWKVNILPTSSLKIERDTQLKLQVSNSKTEGRTVSAAQSSNWLQNNKDHWRDISLNLLGEKTTEKMKKKQKSLKSKEKIIRAEDGNVEEKKNKHFIKAKQDKIMPSLPDIKLPEIQRTYRPNHFSYSVDEKCQTLPRKKATMVSDDELAYVISSRKSRTQVFSGRRSCFSGVVQSLYSQCLRVLADNLDALEDTGGVPFEILEPLLSKASPAQLIRLEEFNSYFTEDSGDLWKRHCEREFRGCSPAEMESWRELYLRKCSERNEKLKSIQLKISESQSKKEPMRQAKLAYVAAPSLQIQRKQMRNRTGKFSSEFESKPKKLKELLDEKHKNEATHTVAFVKVPKQERSSTFTRQSVPRSDLVGKKSACKPMMKAAMKMMKNQRSRSSKQIIRK